VKLTDEMIAAARATSAGKFLDRLIDQEFKTPTGEQPDLSNGSVIEQLWNAMVGAVNDPLGGCS
jgi:hypothetical protein